ASVQFNHQFDDTHYKLSGAINSTRTSFVQESGKQNTNWRQYTVGVNANLINNVRGFASVTRNDGNAQDPNYNFSLGINASF
ncbi:autotransporter outer membrane beta-barrel domain-containing protein, partial [Xenorhabdus bovienii]|uniref:autotransporter outer membrane beta-barrel domain-containing protein n=1 Tax=Xenorhabdus bovienii TaxID=40576 RepID=UPI0023B32C96